MSTKRFLIVIGISIPIMLLLLFTAFEGVISLMNISNVFFFAGLFLFFPGLIMVTDAMSVFNSLGYLTRRMIFKQKGDNHFKTFGDYMEYKNINNPEKHARRKSLEMLTVGGVYLVISFILSFMV
jgi:hypothetical protein